MVFTVQYSAIFYSIVDIRLLCRFGVIWDYTKMKNINSPQEYKKVLYEAFPGSNVDVIDVFSVPDYKTFLRPMIDKKLSNYAKLEETKLQWHFQKTTDSNFPLGVCSDSIKLCICLYDH